MINKFCWFFFAESVLSMCTGFLHCDDELKIETLGLDQWHIYRDLRLQAVKESPQAFGTTYQEEILVSEADWKRRLGLNMLFAKKNGKIVGMVGAVIEPKERLKHIALLVSVYIIPQERGKGYSKIMLSKLLGQVKQNSNLKKIILHVTTTQISAIELYRKFGFYITGILEHEYQVDGKAYDQYIMTRFL